MALGLELDALPGMSFDPSMFGLFFPGLAPIITAALMVELAALLVPRWRRLRLRGYPGRSSLWAATQALALVLAAVQAFFFLRWMSSTPLAVGLVRETFLSRSLVLVVPVVGQLVLLGIAALIDRHGTGHGLSVLIVAFYLPVVGHTVIRWLGAAGSPGADRAKGALLLAGMAMAAVAVSVARRPTRGWERQPPCPELLVPAAGMLPYGAAWYSLRLPVWLSAFVHLEGWPEQGTPLHLGLELVLLVGATAAFTWLANRPHVVAALWRRGPGQLDEATAEAAARAALRVGFGRALAVTLAMAGARWLGSQANVGLEPVWLPMWLAIFGCVAFDLVSELRFRRDHGAVTAVWPIHRTYAVGPALVCLAELGIPAFPRALRHRALLSFLGPHIPVEILVPSARAEEAQDRLRALMLGV